MSNYWNKLSPLHGTVTKRQSHATGGRVGLKDGKSVKATEGASINIDVKSEKYLNYLRKNIFRGKQKADKILKDPKYAKKVQKIWDDRKAKKDTKSVADVRAGGGRVGLKDGKSVKEKNLVPSKKKSVSQKLYGKQDVPTYKGKVKFKNLPKKKDPFWQLGKSKERITAGDLIRSVTGRGGLNKKGRTRK